MKSPTSFARAAASLALALAFAGCGSTPPLPPAPYSPRPVVELERWHVVSGGKPIGVVRHLEIRDPAGPLPFFRIEDLDGRWLGHASPEGRFSRRVPFVEQEEDLGVWSMTSGVRKLLEASGEVSLQPFAVDAVMKK